MTADMGKELTLQNRRKMLADPKQKLADVRALVGIALGGGEVDELIHQMSEALDEIYARTEVVEPEPVPEETLEERIARQLGVPGPVAEPEPGAVRGDPPEGMVQHNTVRVEAMRDLERRVAAGETISRRPAPACNMAARSAGAAIAPALVDGSGVPIMVPGGGA